MSDSTKLLFLFTRMENAPNPPIAARTQEAKWDLVIFHGMPVLQPGKYFVEGLLYPVPRATFRQVARQEGGDVYEGLWTTEAFFTYGPYLGGTAHNALAPVISWHLDNHAGVRHLREINTKIYDPEWFKSQI